MFRDALSQICCGLALINGFIAISLNSFGFILLGFVFFTYGILLEWNEEEKIIENNANKEVRTCEV